MTASTLVERMNFPIGIDDGGELFDEQLSFAFDPDQPREADGKFGSKGGSGPAPNPFKKDLVPGADATRDRRHSTDPAKSASYARSRAERFAKRFGQEPKSPPPPGEHHVPSDKQLEAGLAARVGVLPHEVPPPPSLTKSRMPNLTDDERKAESQFIDKFEADPEKMAGDLKSVMTKLAKIEDKPYLAKTFETDLAKVLSDHWNSADLAKQAELRSRYNTSLHQVANAVTKRAFLNHLDTLKPGEDVLVTCGGCGSGKGFALKKIPELAAARDKAGAIWDSAGDQNSTENGWLLAECEKRGLTTTFAYVHSDPKTTWSNPDYGVIQRANDPAQGRMVDAAVYADSHVLGAKNFSEFHTKEAQNSAVRVMYVDNRGKPALTGTKVGDMPGETRELDRHELRQYAVEAVAARDDLRSAVKRAALRGDAIWPRAEKSKSISAAFDILDLAMREDEADDNEDRFEDDKRFDIAARIARKDGLVEELDDDELPELDEDGVLLL